MSCSYNGRKAAIITLCGKFNYGNRLQNHAVNMLLESRGLAVDTIAYPKPIRRRATEALKRFCGRAGSPEDVMSDERRVRFDCFDENLTFRHVSKPLEIVENYDLIAIGSDQVWNPNFANLKFTLGASYPPGKILTVSPSFGIGELPDKMKGLYSGVLSEIVDISVREPSGAALIKGLTGKDALVTVDPTLAIEPDKWRDLADGSLNPKQSFVFAYVLGQKDAAQEQAIRQACKAYCAQPVILGTNRGSSNVEPGPSEFISLIDNAACVVTDSFHASAFSAMLGTPLVILRRNEARDSFSRLQNLVDMFCLDEAVYNGSIDVIDPRVLYGDIEQLIEKQKLSFISHLDASLERILG